MNAARRGGQTTNGPAAAPRVCCAHAPQPCAARGACRSTTTWSRACTTRSTRRRRPTCSTRSTTATSRPRSPWSTPRYGRPRSRRGMRRTRAGALIPGTLLSGLIVPVCTELGGHRRLVHPHGADHLHPGPVPRVHRLCAVLHRVQRPRAEARVPGHQLAPLAGRSCAGPALSFFPRRVRGPCPGARGGRARCLLYRCRLQWRALRRGPPTINAG